MSRDRASVLQPVRLQVRPGVDVLKPHLFPHLPRPTPTRHLDDPIIARIARLVPSEARHFVVPAQRRPVLVRVQPRARPRVSKPHRHPVRHRRSSRAIFPDCAVDEPIRLLSGVFDRRHALLAAPGGVRDRLRRQDVLRVGVFDLERGAAGDGAVDVGARAGRRGERQSGGERERELGGHVGSERGARCTAAMRARRRRARGGTKQHETTPTPTRAATNETNDDGFKLMIEDLRDYTIASGARDHLNNRSGCAIARSMLASNASGVSIQSLDCFNRSTSRACRLSDIACAR